MSLKKHVSNHHPQEIVDVEANKNLEGVCQACKKTTCPSPSSITIFFGYAKPYHKNDHSQRAFLKYLALYIAKSHHPLSTIKDAWLKWLVLQ
jgi:hypothetical protein